MWQPQEDNTYNDLRENSIREYLEDLKKQIRQLEEKCALKDAYLKKMKEKAGQ